MSLPSQGLVSGPPQLPNVQDRRLLDLVSDLVWGLSLDGKRMTYMNQAAESVYGVEKARLDEHESLWLGVIHPDDRPLVVDGLAQINSKQAFETEFRVLKGDGTQCWLNARFCILQDNLGNPQSIGVLAKDITSRVRAEENLDEARAIYESLVQSIPIRVFRKNKQGRVVFCNQNYCKSIGKTLEELIGKTDEDLFEPELALLYKADDQRVLDSGEPLHKIEEHPGPDGEVSYVEVIKVPVKDARGNRIGIQGVFWDVTERIVSQKALESAKNVAEFASRAKSDFLASVSHEIRTPMNGIIGMTELLLETTIDRQQGEYLQMIRQSAESLLNLINDLLDFSKIESGKLQLDSQRFHLVEMVSDTVRSLALRAHEKKIELVLDFDLPANVVAFGDGPRLCQVISNLVSNAIKFTHQGQVLVRVQGDVSTSPAQFLFEVIDTGIGIATDKAHLIFQEFEQADKSTTRQYGGTGLGLAIASKIVEMMESTLQVESELKVGSRFFFPVAFPVLQQSQLADALSPLNSKSVIVVEDHAPTALALERMLGRWGLQTRWFQNIHSAISEMAMNPVLAPQECLALLLDLSWSSSDPMELVREIRQNPKWDALPIILMTSGQRLIADQDNFHCEKILKPLKPMDILEVLISLAGGTPGPQEEESSLGRPGNTPLKILLAEDNQINQRLARAILEKFGHQIMVAVDGQEAIFKWEQQSFDLILMDVQMPKVDGLEATRIIREREGSGSHVPIVALSAHTYQGFREQCLEAGMDDYLSKPLRRNSLLDTIEKLTGRRSGIRLPLNKQSEERIVDWRQAFDTVGGDRKLLSELIDVFLDEHPKMIREIQESLGKQDFVRLGRIAHGLSGAVNYLGAQKTLTLARKLEDLAPSKKMNECSQVLLDLNVSLKNLTSELQKFKTKEDRDL